MSFFWSEGKVLLIDKPLTWTSFDVTNKVKYMILGKMRRELAAEESKKVKIKVGHAGTLDPLATGLLIVCVGKATKEIDTYMGLDKTYTGTIFLGATTPSYDRETEVDKTFSIEAVTEDQIKQVAASFLGIQQQVPPVYSAIKVDGVRAYANARAGNVQEMKERTVQIHSFDILKVEGHLIDFEVKCSKGTYIRSLVYDFGRKLNNGAYLYALRRTAIGTHRVEDALTIEALQEELAG